ncbi:MAG: hypothetical protein ACRDT8_25245 [Micromonosporaceae bacterium]
MQQHDVQSGVRPGVTAAESKELRERNRRDLVLEQENEMPRRAAAFFAKDNAPK